MDKQERIRWPSPRGAGPAKRSCCYYNINVYSTFIEDGLTDHDEIFRDYGGWLPGREYP